MFGSFRVKRIYCKAYKKLILPTQLQNAGPTIDKNKAGKRKMVMIAKASVCFSLILVFVALSIHTRNGKVSDVADSDKAGNSIEIVSKANNPQLFTLSALALGSPQASNDRDDILQESDNNSVILKYNTSITLPSGQIFFKNRPMYGKVNGKTLYAYNLPDIIFHFAGENIKGFTAKAESGILYNLGADQSNDIPTGVIKENVMIPPSNYMKWTLNTKDIAKIISSPDFTDFKSLAPDTLHFNLTYNNGENQKVLVAITFDSSGQIFCILR